MPKAIKRRPTLLGDNTKQGEPALSGKAWGIKSSRHPNGIEGQASRKKCLKRHKIA
jgi:hypothetical protein